MIQNYNRYRVLEVFFDYPTKPFLLREVSRITKLGLPSVSTHIRELTKDNLIIKIEEGLYGGYVADRENEFFRLLKKQNLILRIHNIGMLDFLINTIQPETISLFGSSAKGEDIENSDIDLFIDAKEQDIDMSKYEKSLKRKIHLFFEKDFKVLSNELKNNIINGIKLYGYLKVF